MQRLIDGDELKTAFPCGETVRTECVRATIDHMPAVEAVPLEQLAELLLDLYDEPCNYTRGKDKCAEIIGDKCNYKWTAEECWMNFLREWMKKKED